MVIPSREREVSIRATGITAYLLNGGTLERAQARLQAFLV